MPQEAKCYQVLAAIPGRVPVVFLSLAANLGQVAVVLAVILDQVEIGRAHV